MRLINTRTLALEQFPTEYGLIYAILSHRWTKDEVLFSDLPVSEATQKKSGFIKLKNFCMTAAADGYDYCWADTCCIDHKSDAEVSEAINSMYRWYRNAAVCYAYLADVRRGRESVEFGKSEWFKRGWTLLELLAPRHVSFFDTQWHELGSKLRYAQLISNITGISRMALEGRKDIHCFSVAERMYWASQRITTRPEDMAYCLLGIFDVHMPLLYGEGGEKAFVRLQEQILRDSDDRSIFAWSDLGEAVSGLLSRSPAYFQKFEGNQVEVVSSKTELEPSYGLSNRGLAIDVRLWPWMRGCYVASIFVNKLSKFRSPDFCILLVKLDDTEPGQFGRIVLGRFSPLYVHALREELTLAANREILERPSVLKTIHVRQQVSLSSMFHRLYPCNKPILNWIYLGQSSSYTISKVDALGIWDPRDRVLKARRTQMGTTGLVSFAAPGRWKRPELGVMLLGFDVNFLPVCIIASEAARRKSASWSRDYGGKKTSNPNLLGDDIATKTIDSITCLETHGWSDVPRWGFQSGLKANEVKDRPGLWAFRLDPDTKELNVKLGQGPFGWMLSICLQEHARHWAWEVTLVNGDEPGVKQQMLTQTIAREREQDKIARRTLRTLSEKEMFEALADLVAGNLEAEQIPGPIERQFSF